MLMMKGLTGIKLKPEFLETCKAVEKGFQNPIPVNTIEHEFVDFLRKQYHDVKDMNEK